MISVCNIVLLRVYVLCTLYTMHYTWILNILINLFFKKICGKNYLLLIKSKNVYSLILKMEAGKIYSFHTYIFIRVRYEYSTEAKCPTTSRRKL